MSEITFAIIAGGKSSRMGRDKALLKINGQPLIERLLERIGNLGQAETFIVTNKPADYAYLKLPLHLDVLPNKGSLGGIYTALQYSHTPYTFVIACDMPFVNADLMLYMMELCTDEAYDVIVPRVKDYPQGLHTIYGKNCLSPILQKLNADHLKVIGFYDEVRVRYLDEGEYEKFTSDIDIFYNVNTPEELAEAQRLASQT